MSVKLPLKVKAYQIYSIKPVAHYAFKRNDKTEQVFVFGNEYWIIKQAHIQQQKSMKKHFKRIAYPLLVLVIALPAVSPRYASAQTTVTMI